MIAPIASRLAPVLVLLAFPALAPAPVSEALVSRAVAQPAGPAGPPAVGVVKAERRAVTETAEFVGRVQAVHHVDVVARVNGFVERRMFEEGAEVHTGDVLYLLERAPFEAQVAQAAAAVAQAQAQLQSVNLTLGRAQELLSTPAGQRSRVEDAQAQQAGQTAAILAAQAQLRLAQVNLDYTEIKSPIDGKISRTLVTVGNVVGPGSGTLATIVSQDPMYVLFSISSRAALDLRDRYAGQGGFEAVVVRLRFNNGQMYQHAGRLNYADPTVATTTDTLTLRATMPNPLRSGARSGDPGARELIDGQFVNVVLEGVQPVQAIAVPRAAVLQDQQGAYVWVVGAENKAEQRRIQLGQSTPETAVISAGLQEGETVVVDGLQRVRPGAAVNPGPAAPRPTAGSQGPRT